MFHNQYPTMRVKIEKVVKSNTEINMAVFSLPLTLSSSTHHSKPLFLRRREESIKKSKKRKRNGDLSASESDPQVQEQIFLDPSTNPLCLNQNEITQYRLAGLGLNEKAPSVVGWPHRGISEPQISPFSAEKTQEKKRTTQTKGQNNKLVHKDGLEEIEDDKRVHKGAQLRIQHVSVLTTILHKCLLNGDITRANRAWAMLLRMQVSGQGIDIRNSGYWGIGAEILIRSFGLSSKLMNNDLPREQERAQNLVAEQNYDLRNSTDQFNIVDGLRRAKDYYERLIIEHPFKRQFSGNVNALDWWPVMIGCEIYGIQFEQAEALRNLGKRETNDEDTGARSEKERESSLLEDFDEVQIQERDSNTCFLKKEIDWQERNHIRQVALTAAESVAVRLDERMNIPPYSENCDMLRLRGMLALYIGDLHVPPKFQVEEHELSVEQTMRRERDLFRKGIERHVLIEKRDAEYNAGLVKRAQEIKQANSLFEKVLREGGDVTDLKEYLEPTEQSNDSDDMIMNE